MGSGYISKETIDAINNTVDIVALIGEYTKLSEVHSGDYWGCCPFHNEKTGSFHVIADKKFYHCFSCQASGNAVKFVMEMEKLSYPEALSTLAQKNGIPIKYEQGYSPSQNEDYKKEEEKKAQILELYERVANMYHYFLLENESGKKALDYILSRGLTIDTIKKFKLGYSPADRFWLRKFLKSKNFTDEFLNESGLFSPDYPNVSSFSDRLMFPIYNKNGQVVAFGGRVIPPASEDKRKYLNSKDLPQFKKREILFGFHLAKKAIRENKKIILCEGNMDAIAYHQCDINYAVATLGVGFTEDHIKLIKGFVANGHVLLSFDSDGAGQEATKKAILLCRKNNLSVKIIRLKGGKDPAEIMLKFGKENLTAQVNGAIFDSDYFLITLGKKYPIDNPEGKANAVWEYFEYVNVLSSDVQKESCLEQVSNAFNLKLEAVKRDYSNWIKNKGQKDNYRQEVKEEKKIAPIKLDAELRGLIAIMADLDQFKVLRSNISENDLLNPHAKKLYKILEECFNENAFSIPGVLTRCDDESLSSLITEVITSGVYQSNNISVIVQDTIKLIKRNSLEAQRNNLLQRIRNYTVITGEDQQQLNALISRKMELDKQVQLLSKIGDH